MVNRRNRAARRAQQGVRQNNNNANNRGRGAVIIRNPTTPVLTQNRLHVRKWMSHVSKPQIAANQNVESRIYSVNSWVVPELLAFMTRYQTVQLNSLGARFVSGMENTSGAIGILILTETRRALYTAPATRNHLWLNQNGCKITPCRS
jgi:hypothetical protein